MIKLFFTPFVVVLLGINMAFGQASLSLSLDSAINHALEYNKMAKNAELAVDEAREKIKESILTGLPQVDAKFDYSNFLGAEIEFRFSELAPPTKIPFNPTSNLVFSVGQLLFSGNYIVGIQTAKLYKTITETSHQKSELDITEQVSNAYYLILVSENSKDILEKNVENIKDVFKKTRAMAEVGIAEETDVDQLSVQVNMLENALKSAERQLEMSYNLLRLQLGVAPETELILEDNLDYVLEKMNTEATLLRSFQIENNFDYQLMLHQEALSKKQVSMEKMNYLPTVTGFYSYTEKILKPDFDISPKNIIGLNVNIPIFSSGVRRSKLSQAKIREQSATNNREFLKEQLLIQEKQYRYNLKNALEQYESQKKNVEVSKRVFNNINLKYEQGLVSSLDLTTANNNYLKAETDYISALMKLLEADLALKKLMSSL